MSYGRHYIAPIRVTSTINASTNSEVHKKLHRKEVKPNKPIKIDSPVTHSKVHRQIYYTTLSQYGGYGAAARAWCGVNYQRVEINE